MEGDPKGRESPCLATFLEVLGAEGLFAVPGHTGLARAVPGSGSWAPESSDAHPWCSGSWVLPQGRSCHILDKTPEIPAPPHGLSLPLCPHRVSDLQASLPLFLKEK